MYNRVVRDYNHNAPLSFELNTYVDAPRARTGSSSTLVTAIVGAFYRMVETAASGEYDMAHLAYDIEWKDLAFAGGKQDQYAATFGDGISWNSIKMTRSL